MRDSPAWRRPPVSAIRDEASAPWLPAAIALRVAATIEGLEVFSYPIWSRWDDTNLLRRIAAYHPVSIDISDYRDAKRAAISAHRTQLGGIIDDDPSGFVLPAEFIDMFVNLPELFWRAPA